VVFVVWDAEAAAARFRGFRGRGQGPRVQWLYGAVLYGWAEHIKLRSRSGCLYLIDSMGDAIS